MRSRRRTQLQYLSLVLPGMIIFTVGLILPMFLAMYYSLTSWNGMTVEKPFVGLSNYVRMFADSYAGNAWLFTLKFTFWNTIIENVAAILLAVALDSGIKGQKLLRTVFFVPCLISAVVVGFVVVGAGRVEVPAAAHGSPKKIRPSTVTRTATL